MLLIVVRLTIKNNWLKVKIYPSAGIRIGTSFAPIVLNQTIALSVCALTILFFDVFGPTMKEFLC